MKTIIIFLLKLMVVIPVTLFAIAFLIIAIPISPFALMYQKMFCNDR
jgi:hypothetical protein